MCGLCSRRPYLPNSSYTLRTVGNDTNMPDLDSDIPIRSESNILVTGGDWNVVNGDVVHNIGGSGKDIGNAILPS